MFVSIKKITLGILFFIRKLFYLLYSLLSITIGKIQWKPPFWLVSIANFIGKSFNGLGRHKGFASFAALAIFLCGAGGYGVWHYYSTLPEPYKVSFETLSPAITNYEQKPEKISPVIIRFDGSVAPIEEIGKTIHRGISLIPQTKGEWRWLSDSSMQFMPSEDWPVDQEYKVNFDSKGLLSPAVLLDKYNFSFVTRPFSLQKAEARLYEDPAAPDQKKIVATIRFSHPVDRQNFGSHIRLELSKGLHYRDGDNLVKEQVFFSDNGLEAYIHSAQLVMPLEDSNVSLIIKKGVGALTGGNVTKQDTTMSVAVPGRYRLNFETGKITFVDNNNGDPEPVFLLSSTSAISDSTIADKVSAWQLPARKYDETWGEGDITEGVLAQSSKLKLTHIPSNDGQSTLHGFKLKAQPGRQIYVRVAPKIESVNGYLSRKGAVVFNARMPDYPKRLSFLSQGTLLSLNGEKNLGVMARGVTGANVEIARILPQQLHHLVDQLDGNMVRPNMSESDFDTLVERQSYKVGLANIGPEKAQYSRVDLSPYLDFENGRRGIFVLRLSPEGYRDNQTLGETDNTRDIRFIVVTDLGIIAKRSTDGSHQVFVQSISNGGSVVNAKVDLLGVNGQPVMTDYTDESGFVHFNDPGELNREKRPLMYVVSKNEDQSFLPVARTARQLDYSRFAIGGLSEDGQKDVLRSFMFTDRGLYRPGELAHIGMIVRAADWTGELTGLPVKLSITDPRGHEVRSEVLSLSREAFETYNFQTEENAPAGTYTASLSLPEKVREKQERFLGSVDFSVRDFEPDRMKVAAKLIEKSVKGWIKPEEVEAKITAMHLFGAPVSDRRVALEMHLSPAFASFDNWRDYRFYIADTLDGTTDEKRSDEKTDENGQAVFDLDLNRFTARAYNLQIYTQVFEANSGRNVAAEAHAMVSSANMMLGIKSVDDLDYVKKDSVRKVTWLAVDQDLKSVPASDLTREWIEVKYVSVLVKQSDGTYRYQSQRRDEQLEAKAFTVAQNGSEDVLNTSRPGSFIIKIKQGEQVLNQVDYTVAGNANASRSLDRNAELKLTLDKATYEPGEDIAIAINAPYAGSGLITIERDNIYAFTWFRADTTSSVQHIRLPQGLEGNAYVNVQFVRSPSSDEVYMSPLSYGVAPFSISLDKRRISAALETPKTIKPGEFIPIKVKLNQPGRVVVYAVDEGILQVARYQQPLPLEFFFRKRALEVTTSQILDLILPEFSRLMAAASGGDGEGALAAHLNPFKRKNKPPVAWWSGIQSLQQGETEMEWQAPDYYNGKLHFFVVAVNEQHVGVTQSFTEVRGPVVLSPNLPAFVAPGDKVKITAGVFSNLDASAAIKVTLQTDHGLTLESIEPVSLQIDSKQEKTAEYIVNIGNELGSHNLQFIATLPDGQTVSLVETISVRPPVERRVTVSAGIFHEKQKEVLLSRNLYSQYRNVEFGAAGSPLVWGQALTQYLDNYGYVCTEQMVSKAMPHIILKTSTTPDSVSAFQDALNVLRSRQNNEGGFGVWNATPDSVPFVSLYAIDFLIDARERGFSIPEDQWRRSMNYLGDMARNNVSGLEDLRNRAYAIYLLTRTGTLTSNELAAVYEQLNDYYTPQDYENDVLLAYMAATHKLMKQDKQAYDLLKKQKWALVTSNWSSDDTYMDALSHDATILTLIARHMPEKLNDVPEDLMLKLGDSLRLQKYNSLSAALLVRALDVYDRALPQSMAVSVVGQSLPNQKQPLTMDGRPPRVELNRDISKIFLEKENANSAGFYFLSEAGYDVELPDKPVTNGLEVTHEYLSLDGKPLDEVNVGEEFLVRLRYRLTDLPFYGDLALVDLLPGGTEIVYRPAQDGNIDEDDGEETSEDYGDSDEGWQLPIGETELSDWVPDFVDARDDRVVLYGGLSEGNVHTFTYRLRAVSAGEYVTPPAFIESMYQPEFHGLSTAGKLKITQIGQTE